MRMRVAAAVALAAGVVISTPAWAIQDDGEESTTTVEVTEAPPPPTATDPPPTAATDPPTTSEAPPSTNANPTTTITIPTTPDEPTSTGTVAQENTVERTTPSQRTSSETAALPRDLSETDQTEPPPTEEEQIDAIVGILAAFTVEPQTVVTTTTTMPSNKVFVCKYTGTPGIDEALQTGQNPISVAYQPGREPGNFFNDAQGRSYSLAWDVGQDEPDPNECPPPNTGTTTTSSSTTSSSTTTTSTTSSTTSTTSTTLVPTTTTSSTTTTVPPTTTTSSTTTTEGPTTTIPRGNLLGIDDFAFCDEETNTPMISITFGSRPDLDGDPGLLTFSDGTEYSGNPLTFQSGQTIVFPYPASLTTPLTLTYSIFGETATAVVELPEDCPPSTTTTTLVGTTTTSTSTTTPASTTSTTPPTTSTTTATTTVPSSTTTTTEAETFSFGAAATVCVAEVPTIRINFLNTFPELAGQTGTLTMSDVNGNVVSTQDLVYQPGTTVDLLYPGTSVNADGSIDDVPGWILTDDGFWIRDSSDEFLREGINLTYTVNPTATAFVTYPPESSACANPDGPFGPPTVPPIVPGQLPPTA